MIGAVGSIQPAHAQGVATGGSAVPARPLRAGMKPPTVEYHDIATQAGLTGVDISGSETSKQYIVEALQKSAELAPRTPTRSSSWGKSFCTMGTVLGLSRNGEKWSR